MSSSSKPPVSVDTVDTLPVDVMACSPPAGESQEFLSPDHSAELKRATFHSKRPVATPHAGHSGEAPTGAPKNDQVIESEDVDKDKVEKEKVQGKDAKIPKENVPGKTPKGLGAQNGAFTPSDQECRFWVVGWSNYIVIICDNLFCFMIMP